MSVVAKLARHFGRGVRRRGDDYHKLGRVVIDSGSPVRVEARVKGSERYRVEMTLEGSTLKLYCSCPYIASMNSPCKHLWATIIEVDARSFLADVEKVNPLKVTLHGDEYVFAENEPEKRRENSSHAAPPPFARFPKPTSGRSDALQVPEWKSKLLRLNYESQVAGRRVQWPAGRVLYYVFDAEAIRAGNFFVTICFREHKTDGNWGKLRSERLPEPDQFPDPVDRQIMSLLCGSHSYGSYGANNGTVSYACPIHEGSLDVFLPKLCATGRCLLRTENRREEPRPLSWDDGPAWQFRMRVDMHEIDDRYQLFGFLQRGEETMPLSKVVLPLSGGIVFFRDRAARLDHGGAFPWLAFLHGEKQTPIPRKHGDEFLETLMASGKLPPLELPDELRVEHIQLEPKPRLTIRPKPHFPELLTGELYFDYGGHIIPASERLPRIFQRVERRVIVRNEPLERVAAERLRQAGFRDPRYASHDGNPELPSRQLSRVVPELLAENWHINAEGKTYRSAGRIQMEVASGIDWFELRGGVDFDGARASFPALLGALKRGDRMVTLSDGSVGMLPEEWLKKISLFAGMGTAKNGHIEFKKNQAGVLDALLAAQPEATCDATFAKFRQELRDFSAIEPEDPPTTFKGKLRPYQREGLGWFRFLRTCSFGGCLADDMGLGKTVQVLAMLDSRRKAATKSGAKADSAEGTPTPKRPSLIVVPKSLVFNWKAETERFAPKLKMLEHAGGGRTRSHEHFSDYDVILTTYGTLRNDAAFFRETEFDYLILDEAQAVKNAATESAKAVKLLRGQHRLALSGTPIENHIGELWTLFDFINPGMLGAAGVFQQIGSASREDGDASRATLSRALRPFILRRTKDQVAKDLPPKLEQTIICELEAAQLKEYNELRDHYRDSLLKTVDTEGLANSKILVLEALLRLRQAACHPGLIDKSKADEPSAKLDMLLPRLAEATEEGHKVLVFSQFTSLLSIVRSRLDAAKITYEYLDGKTRDRAAHVKNFQENPDCKLFLISLKAGGLGLNLTAAEYVFLLDPWWNPAVEAQAVDRAHRIGQKRRVFAYRLITKDTVEEKVLQLQQKKKSLADAIINADNSLIRSLSREDLELLLS
jgi:superfamily II DNA or RNA helicase